MKRKAFVFDLDGTLFETSAREIESKLGHARYSEFADITMLLNESKPLSLLDLAREVQEEGHSVYILTARNSIVYPAIKTLLERYGIKPKYIFTVGDRGFDIPAYKAEILTELAQSHNTYFYDDDISNLQKAPSNIRTIQA